MAKASSRVLPLIGFGYLIANVDRANMSFASLQMNVDLGFSASVYGLGAGIFFLGYSLLEIPSNLLCARFGPWRWIARIHRSVHPGRVDHDRHGDAPTRNHRDGG